MSRDESKICIDRSNTFHLNHTNCNTYMYTEISHNEENRYETCTNKHHGGEKRTFAICNLILHITITFTSKIEFLVI